MKVAILHDWFLIFISSLIFQDTNRTDYLEERRPNAAEDVELKPVFTFFFKNARELVEIDQNLLSWFCQGKDTHLFVTWFYQYFNPLLRPTAQKDKVLFKVQWLAGYSNDCWLFKFLMRFK